MTTTAEPDSEAIEQTLRATLTPHTALTAADRALRTALLRRPESSLIAGVCTAIASAAGAPVRLVRLLAVLTSLLGVGLPGYLVATLLFPRLHATPDTAVGEEAIQRPLDALASFRARPVELLAALAVVPSLAGSAWVMIVLVHAPAAAAVLVVLTLVVLGLLLFSARRAAEARRGLLLAALAGRADLIEVEQLEAFLREQRRRAPAAWAMLGTGAASGLFAADDGFPDESIPAAAASPGDVLSESPPGRRGFRSWRGRSAPRRPGASVRTVIAVLAGMLAAFALTVLVLNLAPELVPTLAAAGPLPQVGRLTAGLAIAAVVSGIALVVLGLRGRRSVSLALVGLLALSGAGLGGTWMRLTHDPQAEPLQYVAADLEAGSHLSCSSAPGDWSQPLVIDLRELDAIAAQRLREQQWARGLGTEGAATSIGCSRPVGDLIVMLPADPELVGVWVSTWDGVVEHGAGRGPEPLVSIWGDVLFGTVTIIEQPGPAEEGDET